MHARLAVMLVLASVALRNTAGQTVVSSFENGSITWTNGVPGYMYDVEWAPAADGPWTNSWTGQRFIAITNTAGTSAVPMFYRVRALTCPCTNVADLICTSAITDIGSVCGDDPGSPLVQTGCSNAWFSFGLNECSGPDEDLLVDITLTPPGETDFNLYVYPVNCAASPLSSFGGPGASETVSHSVNDLTGTVTQRVFVEVRQISLYACSNWTLTITGDQ
jgi:hypothetical protein